MRFLSLLLIYGAAAGSQAANLDLSRRMISARDAKTLSKLLADADELSISKSACRLQLRRHDLPYACYEVLRFEIRAGRHKGPNGRGKVIAKLDELCEAAADRLKIFDADSETTPRCQRAIQRARQIQSYRRQIPEWSVN